MVLDESHKKWDLVTCLKHGSQAGRDIASLKCGFFDLPTQAFVKYVCTRTIYTRYPTSLS